MGVESERPLFQLARARMGRGRYVPSYQIVEQPDVVAQTMRVNGQPKRTQQKGQQADRKAKEEQVKKEKRTRYRQQKYQESLSPKWLTAPDEQIDQAMQNDLAVQQSTTAQGQIENPNPVWGFSPEARRALGYYTTAEREQAARMNDMRSSTFFSGVMPNFGRGFAYNNPGAEMDAFRETSLYFPNSFTAGLSFGLPSATQATLNGIRTGWQTAGNVAQKAVQAGSQAARAAVPVVTNPRWAATTAALLAPGIASASTGDDYAGVGLGLGIGIPATAGLIAYLTKGKLRGKAPTVEDLAAEYAFKPKKGLFTWERPNSWASRQEAALEKRAQDAMRKEWNAAAGNPVKEQEFIQKYNIRSREGVPEFVESTIQEPQMKRVERMTSVEEPIYENVPMRRGDGRVIQVQRQKVNPDGTIATQTVQKPAVDAEGNIIYDEVPVLDGQGNQVYNTVPTRVPKLDEAGQQVVNYPQIEREQVKDYLLGNLPEYQSSISTPDYVIVGPTSAQRRWANFRNAARVASWTGLAGMTGLAGYQMFKPSGEEPTKESTDTTESATDKVQPTDSVSVREFINVTPDGRVIVNKESGEGYDTITPKNYQTGEFLNDPT